MSALLSAVSNRTDVRMSKSERMEGKTLHQINSKDPYGLNEPAPPTTTISPQRLTALITVLITGEQINKAYRK